MGEGVGERGRKEGERILSLMGEVMEEIFLK